MKVENYKFEWLSSEILEREHIHSKLREIVKNHNIKNKTVVEFGSGVGSNLENFKMENRVLGLEVLDEAISFANKRGIKTIKCDLTNRVDVETDFADVALCIDVLEHLINPVLCVEEIHRVLKKNGIAIINVPNHFSWQGRLNILLGSGIDSQKYFPGVKKWNYPHVRFFDHKSIKELFLISGFEILEDHSSSYGRLPFSRFFNLIINQNIKKSIFKKSPDLFSSGFFILLIKK